MAFASTNRATATTLSQNTSLVIAPGNSISCNSGTFHYENGYYRRFKFSDHGISGAFAVNSVTFGVEVAASGSGTQPISVRLYSIDTTVPLLLANLTLISQVNLNLPDGSGTALAVPIAGLVATTPTQDLVVEVFTPDGQAAGNRFLIGSNSAGESKSSYILAPVCSVTEPATMGSLGYGNVNMVITVSGNVGTLSASGGIGPATLGLEGVRPNPTRGSNVSVRFSLASDGAARLELLDVSGRRVASREVGGFGAGHHTVELSADHTLAPGLYWIRLRQGASARWIRVSVLE